MPRGWDVIVEAMGPRQVIGAAVDLLVTRHHITEAAALEMMMTGNSPSHEGVREEAAHIVRESRG